MQMFAHTRNIYKNIAYVTSNGFLAKCDASECR